MGNDINQYELDLDEITDINNYYVDQSVYRGIISSAYTPYGIKCIDSQYSILIRNIDSKVKQLYAINRREHQEISPRTGKLYNAGYKTFYDPIPLDDNYCEVRVEWENGTTHDFFYGDKPVFDINTRKSNPEQLKKEIKVNPHLHLMIKENLLLNLDNFYG